MNCSRCGKHIPDTIHFCSGCGHDMSDEQHTTPQIPVNVKKHIPTSDIKNNMDIHYDVLKKVLLEDEKILWSGQPNPYIFSMWEITMILFGIVYCGLMIHRSVIILIGNWNGTGFGITTIPLTIVTVYLMIRYIFYEIYIKRKSYYAVTSERIIIVEKDKQHVRTGFIRDIPVLNKSIRRSGNGTIMFEKSELLTNTATRTYSNNFLTSFVKYNMVDTYNKNVMAFYDIDGAKKVYDLINEKMT